MKQKQTQYSRQKRKEQVLLQLRVWHENGHAKQATSYKLARALDLEPTQRFREILNEMVEEGKLYCIQRAQSGRYGTKFYLLVVTPLITEKYGKRRVSVKRKGVIAAQLEMWA